MCIACKTASIVSSVLPYLGCCFVVVIIAMVGSLLGRDHYLVDVIVIASPEITELRTLIVNHDVFNFACVPLRARRERLHRLKGLGLERRTKVWS